MKQTCQATQFTTTVHSSHHHYIYSQSHHEEAVLRCLFDPVRLKAALEACQFLNALRNCPVIP
jgi:hypothetical protein